MGDNKGEQGKSKIEKEGEGNRERERERGRMAEICYMAVLHTHSHTNTNRHTCHASYLSDSHHRNYDTMTFARHLQEEETGNRNLKMFAVGELYIHMYVCTYCNCATFINT